MNTSQRIPCCTKTTKTLLILVHGLLGCLPILGRAAIRPDSVHYPAHFRKPLDLPVRLNADFGEFRDNHFHSGLDFYTEKRTGFKVFATGDGYVSRIKVASGGYGQALYITHSDGYVSVYGHLSAYADTIASYLKKIQYRNEEFELDIYIKPSEIPVKKGQIVAYSGNTGFSGGPHLHFEFRDEHTEEIINPLLFGLPVEDHTFPVIRGIYVFRFHQDGKIRQVEPAYFIPAVAEAPGRYRLKNTGFVFETGKVVLGIVAYDTQSASPNPNGNYSVQLSKDGKTIFRTAFERFGFDQTRSINSYLNYFLLKNKKQNVQISYQEPGNTLKLYSRVIDQGVISMAPGSTSSMVYDVGDAAGNTSRLSFRVSSEAKDAAIRSSVESNWVSSSRNERLNPAGGYFPILPFDKDTAVYINSAEKLSNAASADLALVSPAASLFDNVILNFRLGPDFNIHRSCSIGNPNIAIKDSMYLGLKLPEYAVHPEKLVVIRNSGSFQSSILKDGWIWTWIKEFGSFHLERDELAPKIRPLRNYESHRIVEGEAMTFQLSDDKSGIGSYRAELDGHWTLFRYDAKTHLLSSTFEDGISNGKHSLRLTVEDKAKNKAVSDFIFYK